MYTDLEEAITAATAAGNPALIAKFIDPLLLEYVRRYSPLLAATPSKQISTNQYYFNQRTQLPDGGAVPDGGARTLSTSHYQQGSYFIKNYQALGGVTGFAQAVTAGVIGDLLGSEMRGATQNLTWAVETSMIYGNDSATAGVLNTTGPDMLGLDYQVSSLSGSTQNVRSYYSTSGVPTAFGSTTYPLAPLDELIDLVESNFAGSVTGNNQYMFVMSPTMNSRIAQLLTNQQRFVGVQSSAEVAAGLIVPTYRDVPIVKSSFLASRSLQVGAVTATPATTGGTLTAATYLYKVAAVVNRFGEIAASAEVSAAVTGSTGTVTLAVPTVSGPDGNTPILWKVYRTSGATGTEVCIGVVAPVDDLGNVTTSIVDTGTALQVNGRSATNVAPWPTTYVGATGLPPRSTGSPYGSEDIYLVPRDENFLVRPYVRDFASEMLAQTTAAPDVMPFYVRTDTCLAVRGPKYVGRAVGLTAAI